MVIMKMPSQLGSLPLSAPEQSHVINKFYYQKDSQTFKKDNIYSTSYFCCIFFLRQNFWNIKNEEKTKGLKKCTKSSIFIQDVVR